MCNCHLPTIQSISTNIQHDTHVTATLPICAWYYCDVLVMYISSSNSMLSPLSYDTYKNMTPWGSCIIITGGVSLASVSVTIPAHVGSKYRLLFRGAGARPLTSASGVAKVVQWQARWSMARLVRQ